MGEIVYFGHTAPNTFYWVIFIMEWEEPDRLPLYQFRDIVYQPGWIEGEIPKPLLTLDTDGDKTDEIYANRTVIEVVKNPEPEEDPFRVVYAFTGAGNWRHRATAADMDGDGREDLIYEWLPANRVAVHGLNSLDVWADKMQWVGTAAARPPLVLATGNVDDDSAVVRYDGDYELLFTDPTIVAAMASPPYHDGTGQVDNSASTFGKVEGTTVETETAIGFSTGFSVGYEADFGIFGGAEFSVTVEQSLDFTSTQSKTIEKYHSYTSGPAEDKVVFSSVPFDVYYYTIVSSPAPEDVGRTVTINIPREIQTVATSKQFYNFNNGLSPDIDEDVFDHVPGNVASYPTASDRDELFREAEAQQPGYQSLWNGPQPVSEGTGFDTIGISQTDGSGRGASMDLNVTTEFSTTSPGGAKVGGSVGFHYGHSYSITTEDSAFFEGTVGNIPAASYTPENIYKYGLMVYPKQHGGQSFIVMSYWVE